MATPDLKPDEITFVADAVKYLESPSLLMRIANAVGKPLEVVTNLADKATGDQISQATRKALTKTMDVASNTIWRSGGLEGSPAQVASNTFWTRTLHQTATMVTGGMSGLFGVAGLAVELPITTGIMFRSIASIADKHGEDLRDPAARLDCLSVFCLGGPAKVDDEMESAYLSTRVGMSMLIRDAAAFLTQNAGKSLAEVAARETAPVLVRFLSQVAARFNVSVSSKFVAQSLPLVGMATGAAINAAFTDHFNRVANFHFGLRRLDRDHGTEPVEEAYRWEMRQLRLTPRR